MRIVIVSILLLASFGCQAMALEPRALGMEYGHLEIEMWKGASVVIGQIIEEHKLPEFGGFFGGASVCKIKILRVFYRGSLSMSDLNGTIGAVYVYTPLLGFKGLRIGEAQPMVIARTIPRGFELHATDTPIDINDTAKLNAIEKQIMSHYQEVVSRVQKFREAEAKVPQQELSPSLLQLCKQFRMQPRKRADLAKQIARSGIGTDSDTATEFNPLHSPPKVAIPRSQLVQLLGAPDAVFEPFYGYLCGPDPEKPTRANHCTFRNSKIEDVPHQGVLVVSFEGKVRSLHYMAFDQDDILDGWTKWN